MASTRHAVTTYVHVESLPAEADVFSIDKNGDVDKHIGKTPLEIPVSTVAPRDSSGYCEGQFRAWSPAGYWVGRGGTTMDFYKVSLLVTKKGYYDSYVSTTLEYRCGAEEPDDRHLKVRLDEVRRDDQPVQVQRP